MCDLINTKENIFEKALLALLLVSYIQPFMDGNKRTARILSNAILINYQYCPISFRTVDAIEYKKAMLLFYEQNNVSRFKEIFITQFEFAVQTYFWFIEKAWGCVETTYIFTKSFFFRRETANCIPPLSSK